MAENAYFFDTTSITETGWAKFMKMIMRSNGVLTGEGNALIPSAKTPVAMAVLIDTGKAWIQGVLYENTVSKELTIDSNSSGSTRYDRIIVRVTWSTNTCECVVLKGTAGAGIPDLTTTDAVYEIGLATVTIINGEVEITSSEIVDDRATSVCGIAGCRLGHFYIDGTGNLYAGAKKIVTLGTPTASADAATKGYCDTTFVAAANAALTGNPTCPLQATGTDNTRIASTSFVQQELGVWAAFTPTTTWSNGGTPSGLTVTGRGLKRGRTEQIVINMQFFHAANTLVTVGGLPKTPLTNISRVALSGSMYQGSLTTPSFTNSIPCIINTSDGLIYFYVTGTSGNYTYLTITGEYEVSLT